MRYQNAYQHITNRANRYHRARDPYRCTGTTVKGGRCTNPGRRKINEWLETSPEGEWRCWQHGG